MVARRPQLLVKPTGPADVSATVKFAKALGLPLSVRGGGHNVAGNALCDGGVTIDLSEMRSVRVDPVRRTARVEGGATLGDVDHETQVHGLATPLGGVVPEDVIERRPPETIVSLPAEAGEVILVHNHAWHRSGRGRAGSPRRALTVCYMDAATRCLRTKRAPREFFRVF